MRCRICDEPVTVAGDPYIGKAVHKATGQEAGPDGHLAAPIDTPQSAAADA